MDRITGDRRLALAFAAAMLAVVLLAQAATDLTSPAGGVASTGRLLGRTGFAYVSGLRTFAAAVLWNRLDLQFHDYYEGPLDQQDFLMPSVRAVLALDPQFLDGYYVASWVLARKGRVDDGLALAEEGVRANPSSAMLRVSYAQMVWLFEKDARRAAEIAESAFSARWASAGDAFEGYRIMMSIFKEAGMTAEYARAEREYERVKALPEAAGFDQGHDHDGDGKPDH